MNNNKEGRSPDIDIPMSKDKLIPDLRFPEFRNEGEWDVKEIGKLFKFKQGVQVPVENQFHTPQNGMVRFIRIIDITNNSEAPRYIESPGDDHLIKVEDLFMIRYGTPGLISIGFEGVIANNLFRIIWNVDEIYEPKYWFYSFQKIERLIYNLSGSSSMPAISFSTLDNLNITYPNNPKEQQKIAACLSSLDALIAAHSQKLELLKDHKKGLMQNLFPQGGEKVPKVRFKEFENDGEWVEKKLENYIDLFSGIALKSEELSDDESGVPILRGINITEGYIRHSRDIDKYFLGDLENLEKFLVKENDIVIGMDGSKVGKNVAMITKKDENSILIQRVARIRTNSDADINFVYQYFISDKFRSYVDTVNTSSGIPHISAQQIKDSKVWFPPKIREQQKIASCLSSLDALITAEAEKIAQLKLHKKGLMQGLFPKIND